MKAVTILDTHVVIHRVQRDGSEWDILLDLEDYELYKDYTFGVLVCNTSKTYMKVYAIIYGVNDIPRQYLHRVVLAAPLDVLVDHDNGNGLDNRRLNISITTILGNRHNQLQSTNKSGIIGVSWYARTNQWHAQLRRNYVTYHLGYFYDLADAALAVQNFLLEFNKLGER